MTPESNQKFIFQKLHFPSKYFHVTDANNNADPQNKGKVVLVCLRNVIEVSLQEREKKMERQLYVHTLWSAKLHKTSQPSCFQVGHNYIASCLHEKQHKVKIWKLKIKNKMQNLKSYDSAPLSYLSRAAVDSLIFKVFKSSLEGFQKEILLLKPKFWALLTEFLGESLWPVLCKQSG